MVDGSFGIDPFYLPHVEKNDEVVEYLEENNWWVESMAYYKTMRKRVTNTLKMRNSPTALFIRLREDNIAVHKELPKEFLFEIKTHRSERGEDCLIEAVQAVQRIIATKMFGVKILYIFYNPFTEFECGFWVHELPVVREILIPTERWSEERVKYFEKIFNDVIIRDSDYPIICKKIKKTRGSNTPFLVIDKEEIVKCKHWKGTDGLIYNYLHDFEIK